MKFKIGDVINDVTVIESYDFNNVSKNKYKVRCNKCGRERIIMEKNASIGAQKSTYHKHCAFQLPPVEKGFYSSWANMRTRTTNPKYEKKHNYGGRGINSDEFKLFVDFYDAMYESYKEHIEIYGEHDTTLDRLNVNGNYCRSNCVWSTWFEQAGNKTSLIHCIAISPSGKEYDVINLKRFCEEYGIKYSNVIAGIVRKRKEDNKIYKNMESGWKFIEV